MLTWIYDRARIFGLSWLDGVLGREPGRWLNLHAGLDEVGAVLRLRYPNGESQDIFDQQSRRHLPAANQSYDTVFLVLTAHEFRKAEARERLFIEVQRVLRDSGRVVVVEPWLFLTRRAWAKSTSPAGLVVLAERAITPFVRALVLGKQCAC